MTGIKGIEKDFVDFYNIIGTSMGLDNLFVSLFSLLYLEPKDVSMDELAKKTGYSLASVSNKVKILESMNIATRKKKPGSKKIYLYMEKDFFKHAKRQIMIKENLVVKAAKEHIPEIIERYKGKNLSDEEKAKYNIIKEYYSNMLKFEVFLKKMSDELDKLSNGKR